MNAKLSHFSELSNFLSEKTTVCNDFLSLLDKFKLGQSLRKLKMEKEKGASALDLLKYLLIFRLFGQNIHQSLHHQFAPFIDGGKNQFYRFLICPKMDWRRLLCRTVKSFFRIVKENSTDADLERYFILDDTMVEKSGISMEGISRVYDHVAQRSALGYKLLLLVISLHKRFSDYETFGELFRDIKEGLLELTFIERMLPIIAELLEKIARLFDSTLNDLLERAMVDEETIHDLECILRCNQNFKDRPRD